MGKVFEHNTYFFFYLERKLRKLKEVSANTGAVLVENI